ncbi:MAG: N-acyl homoserine lactonase family protein [Candidatus Methanofastidiosia archaeon]
MPINYYVIKHSDCLVVFDAGQDQACVTNPEYYPKKQRFWFQRSSKFQIQPDETASEQMKKLGYSVDDVKFVVLSHLHHDHHGTISEFGNSELVVSLEEWEEMKKSGPGGAYLTEKIEIVGLRWKRISMQPTTDPMLVPFSESFDLMGDGSLTLLPIPGHSPGSISMLVNRSRDTPLLLVGDLTYTLELLEGGKLGGVGNAGQLRSSIAKVLELKKNWSNLIILPTHDSGSAERLHKATAR